MSRPSRALIDLDALQNNLGVARALAPGRKVMAVVKANAYGHGTEMIGRALDPFVDALAVACLEEALTLRQAGITSPVLLLEGLFEESEIQAAAEHGLWLTIDNEAQVSWLEKPRLSTPVKCWLKIDTGMHRLGVQPENVAGMHQRLSACENVSGDPVLCTHFASADDVSSGQTLQQLERFEQAIAGLPGSRSAANSAGVLAWPQAHYDWIRPGYMLYGNSPMSAPHNNTDSLKPVMTLGSRIISVRDIAVGETVGYGATWTAERPSRIATVAVGYGDGYPRLARNGTPTLVNGQRAPLVGRVSMDMITIDVTDLPAARQGDAVTLWGPELPVDEIADCAGTIGYELTTRMPMRTPRVLTSG